MSCGNIVFVDLIEHLLSELSKNDSMSTTRTYIQCIAAISRQAGHRIGKTFQSYLSISTLCEFVDVRVCPCVRARMCV